MAFHIEPDPDRFARGSFLYFVSEGAVLNPHSLEAVYELEKGVTGPRMLEAPAAPSGAPVDFYWKRQEHEVNYYYQSSLLDAPDLWLWDFIFSFQEKSFFFDAAGLSPVNETAQLEIWLQGGSDLEGSPDHHVQVFLNESPLDDAEAEWNGKEPQKLEAVLGAGLLKETGNELKIVNMGDTGTAYSLFLLNRFVVTYPRIVETENGQLAGRWTVSGTAEVTGVDEAHVVDVTGQPMWLNGAQPAFRAEAERSYLVVAPEAVLRPDVRPLVQNTLKSNDNQADYLMIGPRAMLEVAQPLLDWRSEQGLTVMAVPVEEVYQEFGFGEERPEAVRDFLAYAYHQWSAPSPRYVLLLGDATLDPKDYLQTGLTNQVPSPPVKTSFMWTVSDPSYAAVNGEDVLPDLAIGRLPAATVEEAQVLVDKLLAYEAGETTMAGTTVLVADSSIVSYVGHGGIDLWADEKIFKNAHVEGLALQSQQPLLLTLNCLNTCSTKLYYQSSSQVLTFVWEMLCVRLRKPTLTREHSPSCSASITCSGIPLWSCNSRLELFCIIRPERIGTRKPLAWKLATQLDD